MLKLKDSSWMEILICEFGFLCAYEKNRSINWSGFFSYIGLYDNLYRLIYRKFANRTLILTESL